MSACLPRMPALRLAPCPPAETTCTSSSSQVPWEATQLGPLGPGWTPPAGPSGPVSWGPEFPQAQAGRGGWPPPPAMKRVGSRDLAEGPGKAAQLLRVGPLCGLLAAPSGWRLSVARWLKPSTEVRRGSPAPPIRAQDQLQTRRPTTLGAPGRFLGEFAQGARVEAACHLPRQPSVGLGLAGSAHFHPHLVPSCPAQEGTQQERQTTHMHSLPESGGGGSGWAPTMGTRVPGPGSRWQSTKLPRPVTGVFNQHVPRAAGSGRAGGALVFSILCVLCVLQPALGP